MTLIGCIDDRRIFVPAHERGGLEAGESEDTGLTGWITPADRPDSIVVSIRKDDYVSHPSAGADRITGTAPPTLSSADESEDTGRTGWVTSIADDIPGFRADSASKGTRVPVAPTAAVS